MTEPSLIACSCTQAMRSRKERCEGCIVDDRYEINAADICSKVAAVHGLWLTPLDDDGQPAGETRYFPIVKPTSVAADVRPDTPEWGQS